MDRDVISLTESDIVCIQVDRHGNCESLAANQLSAGVQFGSLSVPIPGRDQRANVSVGYRRCFDFDENNQPGQDMVVVRGDDGYIAGIVTDGVGQSFYGNIAAKVLSEEILNWLWDRRRNPNKKEFEKEFEDFLVEAQQALGRKAAEFRVPEYLPEFQRELLEEMRDQEGSQAVMTAALWDLTSRELHLFQVGDVAAIVHYPNGESKLFAADGRGRLSSASNTSPLLKPHGPISDCIGLVLKSDGAGPDWGSNLESINVQSFEVLASSCASSDDVSFLSVSLHPQLAPQPSAPENGDAPINLSTYHFAALCLGVLLGAALASIVVWQWTNRTTAQTISPKPYVAKTQPADAKVIAPSIQSVANELKPLTRQQFRVGHPEFSAIYKPLWKDSSVVCVFIKNEADHPLRVLAPGGFSIVGLIPGTKAHGVLIVLSKKALIGSISSVTLAVDHVNAAALTSFKIPEFPSGTNPFRNFEIDVKEGR
jgi:hypothetical protein